VTFGARSRPDQYSRPCTSSEGDAATSPASRPARTSTACCHRARQVTSAPRIEGPIDREGRITGTFSQQEANDLALVLRSGALPAALTYLEQREVGPSLGADSIRSGVTASLVGLVLVTLFMLVYYARRASTRSSRCSAT
jgi:preprotein translocase subunit SecD